MCACVRARIFFFFFHRAIPREEDIQPHSKKPPFLFAFRPLFSRVCIHTHTLYTYIRTCIRSAHTAGRSRARFLEPRWFSAVGAFVSTGRGAFSSGPLLAAPTACVALLLALSRYTGCPFSDSVYLLIRAFKKTQN